MTGPIIDDPGMHAGALIPQKITSIPDKTHKYTIANSRIMGYIITNKVING